MAPNNIIPFPGTENAKFNLYVRRFETPEGEPAPEVNFHLESVGGGVPVANATVAMVLPLDVEPVHATVKTEVKEGKSSDGKVIRVISTSFLKDVALLPKEHVEKILSHFQEQSPTSRVHISTLEAILSSL